MIVQFDFKRCGAGGGDDRCGDLRAGGESLADLVDADRVAFRNLVVVGLVRESEGDDAEVDEVCGVDSFDRHCDEDLDSEVHRADRGVFAGGALTVAVASDDDAVASCVAHFGGALGKRLFPGFIETFEDDFCVFGDVAAVFQMNAGGHDVVGAGFVRSLDDGDAVDGIREGIVHRGLADGGLADDFDAFAVFGGKNDHGVVDQEFCGIFDFGVFNAEFSGGDDVSGERGGAGRFGADEIGLVALCSGSAGEVAVEGAEGDGSVRGALALSDARTAAGFENAGAGGDDVGKRAVAGEHFKNLAAARGDGERDVVGDLASLEHSGNDHEVAVGAVRAGTDDDLTDFGSLKSGDGFDVVGAGGAGGESFERVEVDFDDAVVFRVGTGFETDPVGAASLRVEECACHVVGGEDGAGDAEFRAHVRDGCALGNSEGFDAFTEVFDHASDVAFGGENLKHLEDDVFCGNPVGELSGELHADDFWKRHAEGLSGHCKRDVESARADRHHSDSASGGGVGVGAEQGFAGDAVAFQVHLMTDSVSGTREADAFCRGDALEIEVVVAVFGTVLHHVVIDVGDREFGGDFFDAHGFEFEVRHGSGRILRKGLVDADCDGFAGDFRAGNDVIVEDLLNQSVFSHIRDSLSLKEESVEEKSGWFL